jgi:hypothetical protein
MSIPGFIAELSIYRGAGGYRTARKSYDVKGTSVVSAALHWGGTWNHCEGTQRKYAAVLWDIPWGANWINTCYATGGPAEVGGRTPDLCEEGWGHVWGNWWISDSQCCECTQSVASDECVGSFSSLSDCINAGCQCCSQGGGGYGCLNTTTRCVSMQCG